MLLKSIDEFVEGGLLRWEFDLSELQYPGSTDIGMWVTCGARIKHSAGRVTFLVRRSSQVHSLLELTRLFEIFDVDLLD
jgi:hypothetical protein